jgi:hypothetical protein
MTKCLHDGSSEDCVCGHNMKDHETGRAVDISGVLEADLKISSRNANSSVKKIWISGIPGKNGKIVYFKKPTQ